MSDTPRDAESADLFQNLPTPTAPPPSGARVEATPGSRRAMREAAARATNDSPAVHDVQEHSGSGGLDDLLKDADTRNPRSSGGKNKAGCLVGLLIFLAVLGGIAGGAIWAWNTFGEDIMDQLGLGGPRDYESGLEGGPAYVLIQDGASGCSITTALYEAGVTKGPQTVCDMLLESGENPVLHPGVFELRENLPAAEALALLADPANLVEGAELRRLTLEYAVETVSTMVGVDRAELPAALPSPFSDGGFIIGESEYYNADAMPQAEVKSFLAQWLQNCGAGDGCLSDMTNSYSETNANAFCAALEAGSDEGLDRIIDVAAQACGINPKLILVMLHEKIGLDLDQLAEQMTTPLADGGFIISDEDFFNAAAMTEAEIQDFLDARIPTCDSGAVCLNEYTQSHPNRGGDQYCSSMAGGSDESAARIIAKVAEACGINPQVILMMLQKEQNLVTMTNPEPLRFEQAMGHACPDTGEELSANCDPAHAGFAQQVYAGARQMQVYTANPRSYNYRAGQVNTIQWHPATYCGSSEVFIQNQATANLYIYTPYRPNIAALAAGRGTGDACSAYGNRNMYNLYIDWFASEKGPFLGAPAQVEACTVPPAAEVASFTGRAIVPADDVHARLGPSGLCNRDRLTLSVGTELTVEGTYGAWARATIDGEVRWLPIRELEYPDGAPAFVR